MPARVIEVIEMDKGCGLGRDGSPYHRVVQYWSLAGGLLAQTDSEINEAAQEAREAVEGSGCGGGADCPAVAIKKLVDYWQEGHWATFKLMNPPTKQPELRCCWNCRHGPFVSSSIEPCECEHWGGNGPEEVWPTDVCEGFEAKEGEDD